MRILTLLVRHGTGKYPNAIADIFSLFQRRLHGVRWDLVVIDNELPVGYKDRVDNHYMVIGGSNSHWEFSAWQDGLNFAGSRLDYYDLVNLATDAFQTLYVAYLDRFNESMLRTIVGRAAAVGHIDYYNLPVRFLGQQFQSWLRTSFVFLPPTELKLLGGMVTAKESDMLFSDDPESPFVESAPISDNYRQYLMSWLTRQGTGQGVEWHSRFDLTAQNLELFKAKVSAILNEHLFSIRLRAQGCALVDTTWLAGFSETHELRTIPGWRFQLVHRDRDAVTEGALYGVTAS
jgi:hypothetical protein